MKRDNKILVVFSGELNIELPIVKGEKSLEYWNIKKMSKEELLVKIAEEFPLVKNLDITDFDDLSWGILINTTGYLLSESEITLLIALFTGIFPVLSFILRETGFYNNVKNDFKRVLGNQNNIALQVLIDSKFGGFVEKYLSLICEYQENPSGMRLWSEEQVRIFFALKQFEKLKTYSVKSLYFWAKEYSDIATIFETLLANEKEPENSDIKYRLKKRAGILLCNDFQGYDGLLNDMYNLRSSYVHGSIFKTVKFEKDDDGFAQVKINKNLFEKTGELKNMLRFVLLCAILSYSRIKDIVFPKFIDDCLLDKGKRTEIEEIIEEVKEDIVRL